MQSLNFSIIEKKLGIKHKQRALLERALTHSSYAESQHTKDHVSNEILEFLGDAVLELVTREYLYKKYPHAHEGRLSELKKMYTSTDALYRIGKKLGVGEFLLMDKGEMLTGGPDRPSNIAGCLEAIIGALYLDRGLPYVARFIERILFRKKIAKTKDYKSLVNQWAMRHHYALFYRVVREEGPPHCKLFYTDLYINRKKSGHGCGGTKKKAEQEAAKNFLAKQGKLKSTLRTSG